MKSKKAATKTKTPRHEHNDVFQMSYGANVKGPTGPNSGSIVVSRCVVCGRTIKTNGWTGSRVR